MAGIAGCCGVASGGDAATSAVAAVVADVGAVVASAFQAGAAVSPVGGIADALANGGTPSGVCSHDWLASDGGCSEPSLIFT
jgi:hypothetical protein